MSREIISALVDSESCAGEAPDSDFSAQTSGTAPASLLAALHTEEGRAAWDLYHRIGDALRSSELADNVSPAFAARMAARMAAEAPLTGPRPGTASGTADAAAPLHTPPSFAEATRGARRALPVLPVLAAATPQPSAPLLGPLFAHLSARQLTLSVSAMSAALAAVATAAFIAAPPLPASGGRALPLSRADLTATHLAAGAGIPDSTDQILVSGKSARAVDAMQQGGAEDLGAYVRAHQDITPSLYRSARYVRPAAMPVVSDK